MIDLRDGQRYRTVNIGDKTWMAENLNYKIGNSWCYENYESACNKYGRLYDWNTAMAACPDGWYLPNRDEWSKFMLDVGGVRNHERPVYYDYDFAGKNIKSKNGWDENGNGTDDFGFSALPGGYRYHYYNGIFRNINLSGGWWSATEAGKLDLFFIDSAYAWGLGFNSDYVSESIVFKDCGFSVRCAKGSGYGDSKVANKGRSGSFIDHRNGKEYRTVEIGNQTWMAENLNYAVDSSWCYNNNDSYCATYGRLYSFDAALEACPGGWHVPSRSDWDYLINVSAGKYLAGYKLKSKSGWDNNGNGTDEFEFSALPGGYRDEDRQFREAGARGNWWSSTDYGKGSLFYYYRDMNFLNVNSFEGRQEGINGLSVRCIKN
jgi:uncharacterized protein (TIGR02145 family)